jgi:allantoinase
VRAAPAPARGAGRPLVGAARGSLLALLLSDDRLDLPAVARLTAAAPAARFELPGKGRIEPGLDADLALVDLGASAELRADDLRYRHRQSPYVGMTLRGRVVATLVRGRRAGEQPGRLVTPAR